MRIGISRAVALFVVTNLVTLAAIAQSASVPGHWVSAWSTAVQAPRSGPITPSSLTFENQTVRMVIRPTIGGTRLRIRLSNEFGTTRLAIGSAHVALVKENGTIVPGSDLPLKFSGEASVIIPAGAPMLSDAVEMKVSPFTEIAVSIFLANKTVPSTFHLLGQHDTYISGPGDFTGAAEITDAEVTKAWYWLAGMEVWASDRSSAIVAFGDSITDGFGGKAQYADWPNQLADRLAEGKSPSTLAVDNEGIGGNRILWDGLGVSALARFDRDVLSQPGVADLIILEGINDIGWPDYKARPDKDGIIPKEGPYAAQRITAKDLIQGLQQLINRAHEHGIKVFGATMTPYGGSGAFTDDSEAIRAAVNQWIRTGGAFDGVFDFDAAVRDPDHPTRFKEDMQSGDHLHPNAVGYKAMAAAIDLSKLRGK